jgi:hypothetical protein
MLRIRSASAAKSASDHQFRPALRRAGRILVVAPFIASTLTGCYSYARVDSTSAPVGAEVATEITDRGRVALADSLGPSPRRLEGRLVSSSDSSITLALTAVRSLRGERTNWTGERITLQRSSFDGLSQRQLNKGRSALAGVLVVGAAVVLALTLGITGGGDGDPSERVPTPPPQGQQ